MFVSLLMLSVVVGLVGLVVKSLLSTRVNIPEHLLHHPASYTHDMIQMEEFKAINEIMRDLRDFPTNVNAALMNVNFTIKHDHIGEAKPMDSNGRCDDPYLVPSVNGKICVFPARVDIGRHFILTGGPDAIREPMAQMVSRVSSFSRYLFNVVEHYPPVKNLFNSPKFQEKTKAICPKDQQVLDPFQFSFVLQVPGQSVPLHTDAPYFFGANRRQFPEWLLTCMTFSKLFIDKFIHQVQGVGYLHEWIPEADKFNTAAPGDFPTSTTGGDFVYYQEQNEVPEAVVAYPRAASFIDGSKAVHAAKVFRLGTQAPELDKSKNCSLVYQGKLADGTESEKWNLEVNGETTAVYDSKDVRMTLIYRARCFTDEAQRERFYAQTDADHMSLDYILDRLKSGMQKDVENVPEEIRKVDAIRNTKKFTRVELDAMTRYDLGMALMDFYLPLPLPPTTVTWMPYNYCALSGLYPFLGPILAPLCGK